jgi:hypothetical protein
VKILNQDKDYVIFSQRLAGYLMLNGCKLKKITASKKDKSKFVYFFYDNNTVRSFVEQYQQIKINGGRLLSETS